MLIHYLLQVAAARRPNAIALIEPGRQVTYAELDGLSNRYANLFLSEGLAAGDRVVLAFDNSIEGVAAYLGTMKAGGVAVPLPAGPRSDRLPLAVADCAPLICVIDAATAKARAGGLAGVRTIFVHRGGGTVDGMRDLERTVQGYPPDPPAFHADDRDLAAIIYTSGSSGAPRGVMLTHRNFVVNARSIVSYLGLTASDRVMCVLPFHYVYGLSLLHTHLMAGGSLVIDNRFAFPNVVLAAMRDHAATGFAGVPSSFALLLHRSNLDTIELPHLRYVTQAGGAMPVAQITEWLRRGPRVPFYVMYGATEAAARLTFLAPSELRRKLGSIGRPIPGVEVVVIDQAGEPAPPGEIGELVARGENISGGYWNRPDETRERFGPLGYRTGDLGYRDDDGYLFLVGRQQDMIKVGSNRVGPKEIEDVLHAHAAVHEAAVVTAPHPLLGEVPVAFVALKGDLPDAGEVLRGFCASRLAPYKVPSRIVVQADLPKLTASGKIDRPLLRELAAAANPAAVS